MSAMALPFGGARDWFDKLAPRERWLVGGAAIFAACAIVFAGVVRPMTTLKARTAADIERKIDRFARFDRQ